MHAAVSQRLANLYLLGARIMDLQVHYTHISRYITGLLPTSLWA